MAVRTQDGVVDPELLLLAYTRGLFPMAESRTGPVRWYSPDPRGIIELEAFRVSRSLRRTLKKERCVTRIDTAFERVMRECAEREETWISEPIIRSFGRLHELGYAHSVETWDGDELVGGLYGVAIGGAFFGESMFSRRHDASKIALVRLVERLRQKGFVLLDTQFLTDHLLSLGGAEISRREYLRRLRQALTLNCSFV